MTKSAARASRRRRSPAALTIAGRTVEPGTSAEILLKISEFYTANPVNIQVTVIRGREEGPVVFLVAAVHGDELNGVEVVRQSALGVAPERLRGTLVCVPVVNRFGFLNHSRYLPDRRDLNRSFPGSAVGSAAARVAASIFRTIVRPADAGVDFHTAAFGRVNLPHVRADLRDAKTRKLALAFGTELIVDAPGRRKSLRAAATSAGIPCVVYEAGETSKFQRREIRKGLFGVYNVLAGYGMLDVPGRTPRFRIVVRRSEWVRADRGGIVDLRVRPGDLVYRGDKVGAISNPFGREVVAVATPHSGVVLGTSTLPMVNPGDALVHVARLERSLALAERHAHVDASGRAHVRLAY